MTGDPADCPARLFAFVTYGLGALRRAGRGELPVKRSTFHEHAESAPVDAFETQIEHAIHFSLGASKRLTGGWPPRWAEEDGIARRTMDAGEDLVRFKCLERKRVRQA